MRHATRRNDSWAWRLVLGSLLLALSCVARAQPAEEGLVILDAQTRLEDGVWFLDADISFQLNETALGALENGLPLDVELTIVLERSRRIIWDDEFATLKQRYQLQFHALTERYITRNLNSGEQSSHRTLSAALEALGQVRGLPLIDDALLEEGPRYFVEMRVVLDIKGMGGPLGVVRLFWNDWRSESDWLRWRLAR
jgi:hypothetical protein